MRPWANGGRPCFPHSHLLRAHDFLRAVHRGPAACMAEVLVMAVLILQTSALSDPLLKAFCSARLDDHSQAAPAGAAIPSGSAIAGAHLPCEALSSGACSGSAGFTSSSKQQSSLAPLRLLQ